jgi:hypothetical protein
MAVHPDPVLSKLAQSLINRKLFRIKLEDDKPVSKKWKEKMITANHKKNYRRQNAVTLFSYDR